MKIFNLRPFVSRVFNRVTSFFGPRRGVIFRRGYQVPGINLTATEALRLSAVWACISVISKAIASSTWEIFIEDENGDREYKRGSSIYRLLNKRPNREMTPFAFHEAMNAVALLYGQSFAEIEMDIMNRPVALWPLDPERSELVRGRMRGEGQFEYDPKAGDLFLRVVNLGGPDTFLPYDRVYHIHGLGLDGITGLNMVDVAARPLMMMMASEAFRLKFYENGATLGGILSTDLPNLKQADLDVMKDALKDRVSGVNNAFDFLVLGGGFKWQSITQDFDKAQFIETNHLLIEECCRYWGVPPHKIAHLLKSSFSNIEHQGIEFTRDGLTPWARRGEQEIDYKLLPMGRWAVRLNIEWASEGDSKTQAETDAVLVLNGIAKRNEVRRRRGWNSLGPQGDAVTVQSQLTTLDLVINPPAPPEGPTKAGPPGRLASGGAVPSNYSTAARNLFLNSVRRMLNHHGVLNESSGAPLAKSKYPLWLNRMLEGHRGFAERQIEQARSVLSDIGVRVTEINLAALDEMIEDDRRLLVEARERGTFENWCNVEDRAVQIVDKLGISLERG